MHERRQGVLAAWVYGKAARGEDRPWNDIDIAVVADDAEVEAVTGDVMRTLAEGSGRFPRVPSLVGLGTGDVARLSAGDPWWSVLVKDAVPLKGDRPEVFASRLGPVQSSTKAKTLGQALDEMGFAPLSPPRRIILRPGFPTKRLKRWRKPKESE